MNTAEPYQTVSQVVTIIDSLFNSILVNESMNLLALPGGAGAYQQVVFSNPKASTYRILGISKAVNATTEYAIHASVSFTDGTSVEVSAAFSGGTHDFETNETVFVAEKPIAQINITASFEGQGEVLFDYVAFQEKLPTDTQNSSVVTCYPPLVSLSSFAVR
jgi:hypothetical protein